LTQEEQYEFTTSHERQLEFRNKWAPKGYFYTIDAKIVDILERPAAFVEVKVFQWINKGEGKKVMVANGFAMEEKTISEFNNLHFFATAQTKAISRALASLGIGIDKALPTFEDVTINSHLLKKDQKPAIAKKESKIAETVPVEDTLLRLRLKYTIEDSKYIISSTRLKDKTIEVLKRYGFKKVENRWTKEINKGEVDDREAL